MRMAPRLIPNILTEAIIAAARASGVDGIGGLMAEATMFDRDLDGCVCGSMDVDDILLDTSF